MKVVQKIVTNSEFFLKKNPEIWLEFGMKITGILRDVKWLTSFYSFLIL
jgi:hypothetical protein